MFWDLTVTSQVTFRVTSNVLTLRVTVTTEIYVVTVRDTDTDRDNITIRDHIKLPVIIPDILCIHTYYM